MKVLKVEPQDFAANSYILTSDDKTAVVIDPSVDALNALKHNNLTCEYVLLTHGHFDHVGGCGKLYKAGARICCGEKEKGLIFSPENLGIFGGVYIPHFEISRELTDGEEFSLCGIDFKAISTPGHTAGGVSYIAGDCLFSGDTLFLRSIGRTDLPTGNFVELMNSLKKLFALPKNYIVYTGHGGDTTLYDERKFNPYAR